MSRLKQILIPSFASGVTVTILALLIMAGQYFSHVDSFSAYTYLLGSQSSGAIIQEANYSFTAFVNTVFGNTTLNKVLFFCFWMFVGLCIYVILTVLIKGYGEVDEVVHERKYVHAVREKVTESYLTRIAVRVSVLLLDFLLIIIFVRFLLPLSRLLTAIGGNRLWSWNGVAYLVTAFVILVLSMHLQVILTRFFYFRTRVWGEAEFTGSSWHS